MSWHAVELWQASPTKVAWLSADHRRSIRETLNGVSTEMMSKSNAKRGQKTEHETRMKQVIDEFCSVHEALESAVSLEGGATSRVASSIASPSSISMRLTQGHDQKNTPTAVRSRKLSHATKHIRVSKKKFNERLERKLLGASHLPVKRQVIDNKCR